jgi:hypothetical protein
MSQVLDGCALTLPWLGLAWLGLAWYNVTFFLKLMFAV